MVAGVIACLLVLGIARPAEARVVRVDIMSRTDVAGGAPFGSAGPYERITGRMYFAFDPANRYDAQIVDLALAPRNAGGQVEAWSDFVILRPKLAGRGADVALVDIVNRGGITTGVFNLGARAGASPDSAAYYGDALLMRRGLTIVALGWQWDVPAGNGRLTFGAPRAGSAARPVSGLVRSDITIDTAAKVMPLGHRVGTSEAIGYSPARLNDPSAILYVRDSLDGARRVLPRETWRFADSAHVALDGGFVAGKIYDVVYTAVNPPVTGAGMAAIRDVISYIKYSPTAIVHARYGVAYGVSQTGRFIRQFLYQDFNSDEDGHAAFDGFFAHSAGPGRGSFDYRFAQPSRDAQPYSTFFYPTDVFPFTSPNEVDPLTGAHGGLRSEVGRIRYETALPKVFYVDGGYEYWGRAASLTHTTVDGTRDVGFLPSERRYVVSSAQHSSPGAFPPPPGSAIAGTVAFRGDPLDQRLVLRALLFDLVDWVKGSAAPPESVYPTIAAHVLVPARDVRFPIIANLPVARRPYQPYRMDLGAQWSAGIIATEPPVLGKPYTVLVPRVDSIGNDLG
ncbi:MAG: alpha/beta hydrolase domain-containing protein, partial [Gemmatimonadaceae bacterium]